MTRPSGAWLVVGLAVCGVACQSGSPARTSEALRGDIGQAMVLVRGATFAMGTDSTEIRSLLERFRVDRRELFTAELPKHVVALAAFYLDRYAVTNADFKSFIDASPGWRRDEIPARYHNGAYLKSWTSGSYPRGAGDLPVTFVTWYAAAAYCHWVGKRLPTEAEWEYAARGGLKGEVFPWGDAPPDSTRVNWSESRVGSPVRVGSYSPNGYGLYDMAGNVWQFMEDESRDDYGFARNSSPVVLPLSMDTLDAVTTRRAIRGGSFGAAAVNLRVRYRDSHPPTGAAEHVGFRCARSG